MESLLDPFSGLRFATTCHTRAYFPSSFILSLAFRSTISSSFRHSEALSLVQAFKATLLNLSVQSHFSSLGVQSHLLVQELRAISSSLGVQSHVFQLKHLEPYLPILGIQSCLFQFQAFKAIYFGLRVQSHIFQFRRSKPSFPVLGIQIHLFQFRHSEPSLSFICVQSHRRSKALSQIGIQNHRPLEPFLQQAFKAIIFMGVHSHFPRRRSKPSSSVRHSEPPLQFQAFKATIFIGLQSHSPYRRSEPPLFRIGVQSHHFHRRSEPPFFFIGVQSHHHSHIGIQSHKASKPFPPQAFKAISLQSHSSHRFSEPRFPFIGIQSHLAQFYFLSQAFKAFVSDRRSEP